LVVPEEVSVMNRLSRAGIAVVLLAGVLWASGVAEAGNLLPTLKVCVDASSGVVSRVASSTKCVGGAKFWSASKSAPLLCWNASSLNPSDRTRVVSVAPSAGCAAPLSLVPVGRAQLLCADGETGVLRWPMTESCASGNLQTWIRSAATPITVATTTTTTSTTSTTAVVVPSVSLSATAIQGNTWPRAVTVTANVAGTIYFAEGDFVVKTVADITSASSDRWAKGTVASANTPTSIAIDVNAVTNGYYRVYVANSQGVLSAPATNIVTISITRASTATTTTTSTTIAAAKCFMRQLARSRHQVRLVILLVLVAFQHANILRLHLRPVVQHGLMYFEIGLRISTQTRQQQSLVLTARQSVLAAKIRQILLLNQGMLLQHRQPWKQTHTEGRTVFPIGFCHRKMN
jgi:hypothetical protein